MEGALFEVKMNETDRVVFRHPDWNSIADSGKLCADMHFHTNCSDSYTDIRCLIDLARSRKTGVAITDHNLISSVMEIDIKRSDVFIIPGMEVSTSDGPHILTYFYDQNDLKEFWTSNIKPKLQSCPWLALKGCTVEDLLNLLEKENCVVSGAHPMGYLGSNKGVEVCNVKGYLSDEVVERLDAYEVICSGMTRKSNLCALEAAQRHDLAFTGGTDGHLLSEVGNVVSVADAEDLDGFLDSVVKRKNIIIGKEKNVLRKVEMGSASFSKFIRHAPSASYVQLYQGVRSMKRGVNKKLK